MWRLIVTLACLAGLGACAQLPRKNVVEGPTNTPPALPAAAPANGSIFASAYTKPLFEDRRPRQIGDILTIVLDENVSATKSSAANASRDGSLTFKPTVVPDVLGGLFDDQDADLSAKHDFDGRGGANASNTFVGTITTTVMNVLPNGNLEVAGEKRIGINQGVEYILFSGTVNPRMIRADSTITSNQVANVRLEYYGDGYINEAQNMGWFQRLLLNVSPF
ncbi:flagellar basal body L-ring protein [Salinisphaera sp. T31B1]